MSCVATMLFECVAYLQNNLNEGVGYQSIPERPNKVLEVRENLSNRQTQR